MTTPQPHIIYLASGAVGVGPDCTLETIESIEDLTGSKMIGIAPLTYAEDCAEIGTADGPGFLGLMEWSMLRIAQAGGVVGLDDARYTFAQAERAVEQANSNEHNIGWDYFLVRLGPEKKKGKHKPREKREG